MLLKHVQCLSLKPAGDPGDSGAQGITVSRNEVDNETIDLSHGGPARVVLEDVRHQNRSLNSLRWDPGEINSGSEQVLITSSSFCSGGICA